MIKITKLLVALVTASAGCLFFSTSSSAVTLVASENAGLTGTGTVDESAQMTLRNRFGYTGQSAEQYAYFRFTMDAANDTVGGIAVGDLTSVTLDLNYITVNTDEGSVFALDDLANPGAGFLTETSWTATGANELDGTIAPHGNEDVDDGTRVTEIGNYAGSGLSTTGLFQLELNLTEFQNTITSGTNDEFTLIVDGPKNGNNVITSLGNGSDPALTLTVPEPSAFALLAGLFGFACVMLRRRI